MHQHEYEALGKLYEVIPPMGLDLGLLEVRKKLAGSIKILKKVNNGGS